MNWVPLFFIDAVCHQLKLEAFQKVSDLSADWSRFGAEHRQKRREFAFFCRVDGKESSYAIEESRKPWTIWLLAAELNLKFDRIRSVSCTSGEYCPNRVSLDEFKRYVLPTVSSLVTECEWGCLNPDLSDQNRIFFNAFKNSPGFNYINVQEQGEESQLFVTRQVKLGNVRILTLNAWKAVKWPKPEKLAKTLHIFVNSSRFHRLKYYGPLPNDTELFALFLERALAGELKRDAFILLRHITSVKSQRISGLRPECREACKAIAWRIPNSNFRILLRQHYETLWMEVE